MAKSKVSGYRIGVGQVIEDLNTLGEALTSALVEGNFTIDLLFTKSGKPSGYSRYAVTDEDDVDFVLEKSKS